MQSHETGGAYRTGLGLVVLVVTFAILYFGVNALAVDNNVPALAASRAAVTTSVSSSTGPASTGLLLLPLILKAHVNNVWHPLTQDAGHHHGVKPEAYEGIFGQVLTDYLEEYGSISYPWQTPNENLHKHSGYFWLYDEAEGGCEQFNISGNPNCVTHVLLQLHSLGTAAAAYTRFHSQYAFVRVCAPQGSPCGVIATGGHADYGILHAPYKEKNCKLPSDPPGIGDLPNVLHQTPYRSNPVEYRPGHTLSQFWNSLGPNPLTMDYFPEEPNRILGLAWLSADSWAALDSMDCTNAASATIACADGSCNYNHSRFFIFSVRLRNLPDAPFTGWTNRWGHVVSGCTEASVDCVPLLVSSGTPDGEAWLNRSVSQSNPGLYATGQEFDVQDANENTLGWITHP